MPANAKNDTLGRIMDYESGQLDEDDAIQLFQDLIDSGLAWKLQGNYGRTAQRLIEAGLCRADGGKK